MVRKKLTTMKYNNPCPTFNTCAAAYCPATMEGNHADGDDICFRVGEKAIQRFNRSAKDAEPGEIQKLIQLAYDNRIKKKKVAA